MDQQFLECTTGCGTSVDCILQCSSDLEAEQIKCPCEEKCPRKMFCILPSFIFLHSVDCPCPEFDCGLLDSTPGACSDPESNPDAQMCYDISVEAFVQCVNNCGINNNCISECESTLNDAVEECPCGSGCPSGCPCPNYDCAPPDVTTTPMITTTPFLPWR